MIRSDICSETVPGDREGDFPVIEDKTTLIIIAIVVAAIFWIGLRRGW